MKKSRFTTILFVTPILIITAIAPPVSAQIQSQLLPTKLEIAIVMRHVNDYWIAQHPDPGDNKWARAVYFIGDMAHYLTTGEEKYRDYASAWAENDSWQLNGGCYTTNADNQVAGQTYLALNDLYPDPVKIGCITTCINNIIDKFLNNEALNYWWWIDALHMAMPLYAKLAVDTDNSDYSEAMYALYRDTKSTRGLYNANKGLWYRDENFKPENQNGRSCAHSVYLAKERHPLPRILRHVPGNGRSIENGATTRRLLECQFS